jgi:hypothetical protein
LNSADLGYGDICIIGLNIPALMEELDTVAQLIDYVSNLSNKKLQSAKFCTFINTCSSGYGW